jgi:hypothetical protein
VCSSLISNYDLNHFDLTRFILKQNEWASFHREACLSPRIAVCISLVKTVNFNTVKRLEARSRVRLAREAARSPKAAAAIQKRVSLVGDGAKWEITNLKQFARAAAGRWA